MNAPNFNRTLNTNEIYSALTNLKILFQMFRPQTVLKDPIVAKVNKATGMFGDTGVIHGLDLQGTYDFTKDLEAGKLLQVNRNKSSVVEAYTINRFRQTDVTNDNYLSKRAFLDEATFSVFNSYLVSTLTMAFDAYENGFVKSGIGSQALEQSSYVLEVTLPTGTDEPTYRRRAALIKEAILNLAVDMKDNQRKYNRYKHYASYDINNFEFIMSAKYKNEINALSYYSMFDKSEVVFNTNSVWTKKWFGKRNNGTSIPVGAVVMEEINSDGTFDFPLTDTQIAANVVRLFPGDIVDKAFTASEAIPYSIPDESVIGIMFDADFVAYLTGFEQSESWQNKRSATTNHYARKGFSDVLVSGFSPFIVIKEANAPNP